MSDEVPTEPMDEQTPTTAEPTTEAPAEPAQASDTEEGGEQSPFTDAEPAAPPDMAPEAEAAAQPEPDSEAEGASDPQAAVEVDPGSEPGPLLTPIPLELYFLRHADAGDPMVWEGNDADRPLSKKGRRQAKRLGRHLDELHLLVDAVLTSPRVRAADTARIVAKAIGAKARVDDRLGIDFKEEALVALVAGWEPDVRRVIVVGHDPDFTHLVSWLAGSPITMRKGALARVDLTDRTVGAGRGSVRWLLPPDAIAG